MAVKEVKNGYVIDFTIGHQRYRETIPAPINKSAQKRIEEQESVYKMAISLSDKAIAARFPNSKITKKPLDGKVTVSQLISIQVSGLNKNSVIGLTPLFVVILKNTIPT